MPFDGPSKSATEHLDDFEERFEDEKDRAIYEARDLAKRRVPVDTGQLRDDISIDLSEDKIYNTLMYAIYQNYGTSNGVPSTWYMTDSALDAFQNSIDRLTS
ncbi:hypothetical protein OSG_eHP25_00030 [environmental Halophage eHP-25]|nr:hypothetical protein OSG_eHP25_00030 [environmental Halophage eHP-25]